MDMSIFLKMAREGDSLERVLNTVESQGCEVVEMTARSSLDKGKYFVRLELQGNGTLSSVPGALTDLRGMEQVEVLPQSNSSIPA